MKFDRHLDLEGFHAPFSASQSSWLRYTDEKALEVYKNKKASEYGTRLHEWAKETILLKIRQPRSKKTLSAYVNDAIGFDMTPEVVLFYSKNFFGTADTISFKDNVLRIHDLKTGSNGKIESHLEQLYVYSALFCLEYNVKPEEIEMYVRVYKLDECIEDSPDPKEIRAIMNKIIHLDKLINTMELRANNI